VQLGENGRDKRPKEHSQEDEAMLSKRVRLCIALVALFGFWLTGPARVNADPITATAHSSGGAADRFINTSLTDTAQVTLTVSGESTVSVQTQGLDLALPGSGFASLDLNVSPLLTLHRETSGGTFTEPFASSFTFNIPPGGSIDRTTVAIQDATATVAGLGTAQSFARIDITATWTNNSPSAIVDIMIMGDPTAGYTLSVIGSSPPPRDRFGFSSTDRWGVSFSEGNNRRHGNRVRRLSTFNAPPPSGSIVQFVR